MDRRFVDPGDQPEDQGLDPSLRPERLDQMLGQDKVKKQLGIAIAAARERGEALDHVLLSGPPGLGKTTLARVIANEMDVGVHATSGPLLNRPVDLAGIVTALGARDVLFIDEVHRVNREVEEYLYSAMEDYRIDILIDSGPTARSVTLDLERFTLVGATTRQGLLTAPMRARFLITAHLDYYSEDELVQIVLRDARLLGFTVLPDGAGEIARRARGTARLAKRWLRRCRDYAQVEGAGTVDRAAAAGALESLKVDELGLDEVDRRLLEVIIEKFGGGPVGVNNLAAATGEEEGTIIEVFEPYLIQQGFLKRTPRGRQALPRAYAHLGLKAPAGLEAGDQMGLL